MKPLSFRWFGLFLVGIFVLSSSAFTAENKPIRINLAADSFNQTPIVARVYFADLDDLNRLGGWLDVWEVNHAAGYLVAMLSPATNNSCFKLDTSSRSTCKNQQSSAAGTYLSRVRYRASRVIPVIELSKKLT